MPEEKFVRINIKEDVSREINILAAAERRSVYEVVDDMLQLYKMVAIGKPIKKGKKLESVPVADVIATH